MTDATPSGSSPSGAAPTGAPPHGVRPAPGSADKLDRLKALLRELFQLDRGDLDFGLYRIMNPKTAEVAAFLDRDLLPQMKTKLDLDSAEEWTGLELGRYSSGGRPACLIPCDGEEVKLHWANANQYYVETTENYASYTFTAGPGDAARRVRFEVAGADNEKDNVKEAAGRSPSRPRRCGCGSPVARRNGDPRHRPDRRAAPMIYLFAGASTVRPVAHVAAASTASFPAWAIWICAAAILAALAVTAWMILATIRLELRARSRAPTGEPQ